jgi:adenylate kinase
VIKIVITGNPGVGKHTIGIAIAEKLNYYVLDLNKFVIMNNAIIVSNKQESFDVDIRRASLALKKELSKDSDVVIIGHLAPYLLRSNQVDFVAILRRSPSYLLQTYKRRNYAISKIKENIAGEILGVCSYDTIKQFGKTKIAEFDTSRKSPSETVRCVIDALNNDSKRSFGVIDWLSTIENEPHLLKLILS